MAGSDKENNMWYVVWAATTKEHQLLEHIEREFAKELYNSVWLPIKVEKRKINGEWNEVEKLLFPGYMFLDTDYIEEVAMQLRGYVECMGILKVDDEYAPISKSEEEILYKLTGGGGRMDVSVGYIEDGRVRILSGPLYSMEDYIISVDKHKRVAKVQMELFCDTKTFTAALELVNK